MSLKDSYIALCSYKKDSFSEWKRVFNVFIVIIKSLETVFNHRRCEERSDAAISQYRGG